MRILLLSWLLFSSYFAIFLGISNLVLVSGQCRNDQKQLLLDLNLTSSSDLFIYPIPLGKLMKWNQAMECCSWDGVSCDGGGHVIGLDLSNRAISSSIDGSSSLFRLQHLQRLNLASNQFMTAFPAGFDKLENLSYLNLSNAGFTGQIPAKIPRLTRLITLDLSTDPFLSGEPLKLEKPNLEMLVQNLTRLRFLYLDGVNISAMGNEWCRALSPLTELQVLSMSNCYLSGPIHSSLSKLQSLSVICLDYNNLSASVPQFFAEFPNLTSLSLRSTGLNGRLPDEIFQIPTLQTLDLSYNMLLKGSFPNFPLNASLQALALSSTKFGGQIPESLDNLGQLTRIELAGCNFSGPIPKAVEKLTQLVSLDFSNNNFSGPIPSFSSSRNLTNLSLAHNKLVGTIHSTDWSSLSKLEDADLGDNKLSGTIPPTLFGIPSLQRLDLSHNQFNGSIGDFHDKASSLLNTLDLSNNKLKGQFPTPLFELRGLEILHLSSNNFSGLIPMNAFQNLGNLLSLDLSHNRLSIDATATNISLLSFPTFTGLGLASCNLTEFPGFLKNQSSLMYLDLSNNHIHGKIPDWIWKPIDLLRLNLSDNFLVGFERPLKNITSSVQIIDLHVNQLQGEIPIPTLDATYLDYSDNNFSSVLPAHIGDSLQRVSFFSISNNNIHGSIPPSICSSTSLRVLDLSNNSLSGPIPQCLFQMSGSLGVLDLRQNNLSGIISDTFSKSCKLQTLKLDQNRLEGKVPKSLGNCKMLEVLDIGNNQINDSFPWHLKNIAKLHVLVLRSNKFNGHIDCSGNNGGWSMLQIFDLASNNFSGKLHLTCLGTWDAMQHNPYSNLLELKHLHFVDSGSGGGTRYQDAITITTKGLELELVKILPVFTSIDISWNNFEGPIPEVIGKFKELHGLNFSHNAFTGPIPSSFGNLRELESLDLSSNSLRGEIPLQLANLNFLSCLNVSNNKLVGPIPTSTQLQSFPEASFENNAGLCGPPLKTKCGLPPGKEDSPSDSETGSIIHWNHLSIEIGFTFGLGIIIVPLIYWKRWRIWYFERIDLALSRLFPHLGRETKKHGRRAKQNQRGGPSNDWD
ncbi:hypothetical protein ES319_A01G240500v1 [Gossypium barbadense]|uniref:Leucine-rich-repeat receptor-like protein n=1 Tax=Gossypium barbadense TaxID=3634 RepID=A0A097BR55_GOSBA|nr:leucine-rich-repeat receptor-like protein [Gossypium barbadense]KAB2098453.1 hypothetical protein ES319_A01G240500v1 [Gossypium barbadense]